MKGWDQMPWLEQRKSTRDGRMKPSHACPCGRKLRLAVSNGKQTVVTTVTLSKLCFEGCCCCLVAQSCLTLCDPMACSLPGTSVHGFLQAWILEWVAMPSSRGSSWPRDRTWVSCTAGRFFTAEPPGKPILWILTVKGDGTPELERTFYSQHSKREDHGVPTVPQGAIQVDAVCSMSLHPRSEAPSLGRASQVALVVKSPPANAGDIETWV